MTPSFFKKLDLHLDALDFQNAVGEGTFSAFPTIYYLTAADQFRDQVLATMPPIAGEARIAIGVVPAGTYVPPHCDYMAECAVNIYYQPGGECATRFFNAHEGAVRHYTKDGRAHRYNDDDVDEVGFFVAQPMESYLLNVSRIHCIQAADERRFVSVLWRKRTFEEVVKELS
jgi:hypothetical protein